MRFLVLGILWSTLAFTPSAQAQSRDPLASNSLSNASEAPGTPVMADTGSNGHFSPQPIRVDVDLVLVPVTVSDSMNRPVVDLARQQFAIYEDGKQQQIRYFSREDAPLSVGLLLDVSNSMADKIDMEREAVGDFFRNSNPQDDFFVISFADRPKLLGNSSDSIGTIQSKLSTTKPAGYTALLDAIYLAVDKLHSARYQRHALVIISDGGENNSRYKADEIKSLVEETDVQIYAIRTFDALPLFRTIEEKMGNRLLSDITQATGGRTISVDNAARIPEAVAAVSRELRNQYLFGYCSNAGKKDGKWRKIKVAVLQPGRTRSRLHLEYKKGYFAPRH